MGAIADARTALADALRTVPSIRVYTTPNARVDPPGAVLSLPDLEFEAYCTEPTKATFSIALVAKLNERAVDVLEELVLSASTAIEAVESAVVLTARIGAWDDQLPAYELEVEVALT